MRRIDVAERRARLAARHHLTPACAAATPEDAARAVVGLHATDPAAVHIAVAARVPGSSVADVERALYEDRSLVRLLAMRRTMFVVPTTFAPVVHAAATRAVAATERRRLVKLVEDAGVARDGARWVRRVEADTIAALRARGGATATQLAADVEALRTQIRFGEGKRWEGVQRLSGRVLSLLASEGHIVRGRPRGTWVSAQYRWEPVDDWLPVALGDEPPDVGSARSALVAAWLARFGPGTVADVRWWTGWSQRDVVAAMSTLDTVEVALDGGVTGLVLAADAAPVAPARPGAFLLPALDASVMGWQQRDWYLGDHAPALFDRSGNAGPTVWWDGHVVGGWAQRAGGVVVFRILEDVGREATRAVGAAAERLTLWFSGTRVTPRFRTPLERELAGT